MAPIPPSRFKSINFMYKRLVNTAEGETGKRGFREKSPGVSCTSDGREAGPGEWKTRGAGPALDNSMSGNAHVERRQHDVDLVTELVDSVEAAGGARVDAGDVVTVIGKVFAGRKARGFADDAVALDDQMRAIGVVDHPFAAEQRDRAVGAVFDGDEIDERVGLVLGQTHAAVMINEFIETGGEAGKCEGSGHGRIALHAATNPRKGALQMETGRVGGLEESGKNVQ